MKWAIYASFATVKNYIGHAFWAIAKSEWSLNIPGKKFSSSMYTFYIVWVKPEVTHCWQGSFPDDIIELGIHIHDGLCSCIVCLPSVRRSYSILLRCKILQGRGWFMTNSKKVKFCGSIGSFISILTTKIALFNHYNLTQSQWKTRKM